MRVAKVKIQKTLSALKSSNYSKAESAFIVSMIRQTPVTAERIAIAEIKASKARSAKSAIFLEKYRSKEVA